MKNKEFKKIKVPFIVKKEDITEDDQYFNFEGYASTFGNADRDGDIIDHGAFTKTLAKLTEDNEKLPVLWQHSMDMPLGIYLQLREDEKGLFVKARMPKSDTFVTGRVIPQMKVGSVSKMSIGFWISDFEWKVSGPQSVRIIKEIELLEVSLVTIPANPKANITDMKRATPYGELPFAARNTEWDSEDAKGRIRVITESIEKPSFNYKKSFFWYDEGKEDRFAGYKLPFADVVNNQIRAIPRGIFAAAAALRGARGGVDIPEEDLPQITENINRYYSRMRHEFMDDTIISPFEQDIKTMIKNSKKLSEIEKIIKNNSCLSNKESQMIISKINELKAGEQPSSSNQSDSDKNSYCDIQKTIKQLNEELNKNG